MSNVSPLNIEENKDVLKSILIEEKGILPTTNTTNTTFTTKINQWGYVNTKENILLEKISQYEYIYNINGDVGISRLKFKCPSCACEIECETTQTSCSCGKKLSVKNNYGLFIKEKSFYLESPSSPPIWEVPKGELLKEYLAYPNKIPRTKELFEEITTFLKTLFDFQNESDSKICSITILFTYVLLHFNSSFYLGIDATKGSGKTTLLEILSILSRHGFLAECSPASIPRLKQKYDLNIFTDEIDQLKNGEDIEGLLRKGQRRGNKYVRLNKNSLEEEIYEAFGFYSYSFRSNVEDAFKQRSVLIRTARAKDSRLSIINLKKSELLQPLFTKIFMWYIQNIFVFGSKSSRILEVVGGFTHDTSFLDRRNEIYLAITEHFSKEEQDLINSLLGRNSEIGYLFLETAKFLEIDLLKEIKQTMNEKQTEEETPDDYYYELIKNIFDADLKNNSDWLLSKGDFAGYRYFPKTEFYMKLIGKLKGNSLMGIGTSKYNQLLKDIGFITNYNIKNQKVSGNPNPKPCLIFSDDVLKKLSIDYTNPFMEIQR